MFSISNGHLCKSEPFDAANFGLKSDIKKSTFLGNAGVTLHIPNMDDQYRDVDIFIPAHKIQVSHPTVRKKYCRHSDQFNTLRTGIGHLGC